MTRDTQIDVLSRGNRRVQSGSVGAPLNDPVPSRNESLSARQTRDEEATDPCLVHASMGLAAHRIAGAVFGPDNRV
jgi:hypothetical protein